LSSKFFQKIPIDFGIFDFYIEFQVGFEKEDKKMIRRKNQGRFGFTLMEIMVVIIVIAVLASVAGPMIGSITDQGKASATRAAMQNIKTALVNYNNDLGKFPFTGTNPALPEAYNAADTECLGADISKNVLVSNSIGSPIINLGSNTDIYKKRWKGPYMDSDPAEFMVDAWESKIHYKYYNHQLFLHSYGPDNQDDFVNALSNNYEGDDIVMSISRTKF